MESWNGNPEQRERVAAVPRWREEQRHRQRQLD
jgi:hypothetical protein